MNNGWCRRVCIIAEGYEEKYYLERLRDFNIFNHPLVRVTSIQNAKGIVNVFALFQSVFNSGAFDLIVVFCDGDNNSKQFNSVLDKINNEIFGGNNISQSIVFFVNPVTLQVVLSHFGDVTLTHKAKANNNDEVERLTGIVGYKAKEQQVKDMVSMIKYGSYVEMKERISKISKDVNDIPSTNFLDLLEMLEGVDIDKLDELIKILRNR